MAQEDIQTAVDKAIGPPLLLTIEQTCDLTNLSRSTIYKLIREKRLSVAHLGRSARIARSTVEAFVAELIAESAS